MKVAQLLGNIPDLLPPEYAAELTKLQSEAPPMGWSFVKRRMGVAVANADTTDEARRRARLAASRVRPVAA